MNKYVTNLTLPNGTNVLIKDSECRTNLSNEINRATEKETLLQQNINAEASAREQADTALHNAINALINPNKKYIFIGDSYGDREVSWTNYLVEMLGLTANDYYKNAIAGYGFKPATYTADFISLLKALSDTITDKESITDIIVQGGFNDNKQDSDTLFTAIESFCSYAKTNYPNATVHIGAFGWSFNSEFVDELNFGNYVEVYKRANELSNAKFIGGSDYIMHNFDFYLAEDQGEYNLQLGTKYVHPNNNGSKEIANCIYAHLNGKEYHYQAKCNCSLNLAGGISLSTSKWLAMQTLDDNIISMFITEHINFEFASKTVGLGDYVELGSIPNGFIAGNKDTGNKRNGIILNCNAFVATSGGNNEYIPVTLHIMYNKLYAKVFTEKSFTNIYIFNAHGTFNNKLC